MKIKEKEFKPNLIPKKSKSKSFSLSATIKKNGGYDQYRVNFKKIGCRLQLIKGEVLDQNLNPPTNKKVVERFQGLANKCNDLNISLDGEFYMHGLTPDEIKLFFENDVTDPEFKNQFAKEQEDNPKKFKLDYNNRSVEFLTTFHDDLKFHLFDGLILDLSVEIGFDDRIKEITNRLKPFLPDFNDLTKPPGMLAAKNKEGLDVYYKLAIKNNYKGLILTHKDHIYKFGQNTLKEGTLIQI